MYECFNCGAKAVIWGADFDPSDYGYEWKGVIHHCHCSNCGADIEYFVKFEEDEGDENTEGDVREYL